MPAVLHRIILTHSSTCAGTSEPQATPSTPPQPPVKTAVPSRKATALVKGSSLAAAAAFVPSLESLLSGGDGGDGGGAGGLGGRGGGEPSGPGGGPSGPQEVYEIASGEERRPRGKEGPVMLTLVSFAVTKMAYIKITRLFAKWYKEKTGCARDASTPRTRLCFSPTKKQEAFSLLGK